MPRKFLGQKLLRDVDFVRPSSLTLTNEELNLLPLAPLNCELDTEDKVFHGDHAPEKISGKFGGTLKLRKRLESVPELFLNDFRKKTKGGRKTDNEYKTLRPAPVSPMSGSCKFDSDEKIDSIFVRNPITFPVILSNDHPRTIYKRERNSRSTNEILYDEIIEAYTTETVHKPSKVLQDEISRIVDNISRQKCNMEKQKRSMIPTVTEADDIAEYLRPPSPCFLEPAPLSLHENISSPEYTGGSASDTCSSSDVFSDLRSVTISKADGGDDDSYFTATNSISSVCHTPESKYLDVPSNKQHSIEVNRLTPMRLRITHVKPIVLNFSGDDDDDEDDKEIKIENTMVKRQESVEDLQQLSELPLDPIELLQNKINLVNIDMQSCSSSVYSYGFAE